jgi:hypothetical protein
MTGKPEDEQLTYLLFKGEAVRIPHFIKSGFIRLSS